MILGRISENLMLFFPPAFLKTYLITPDIKTEIDFRTYMEKKGIELIGISDDEQKKWGCSFIAVKPNVLVHYDIALRNETRRILACHGVEIIDFHPAALLAGGGSLRCLTLRILRD
jgi:arginine deiminase